MLIDLSVFLNEATPVYPGDPATKIRLAGTLDKSGYQDHYVCLGTHIGTHMDAPSHMVEGGKNLHEFPLERFSGHGVLVTVNDPSDFDLVREANLKEGDVVLFATDMSKKYYDPAYFSDYPAMSKETASYLVEKKVGIVGIDTCSVDNEEGFPIHKLLLGSEVLLIENLTNLEALKGKDFRIHAYPIKLELDGAPVRVVAEVL